MRIGSTERHTLYPRHRVGRAAGNDLVLGDSGVSAEHAVLAWSGSEWTVRDLGSRNGTRLSNAPLAGSGARPLRPGMQVAFGSPTCAFVLVDGAAPVAAAQDLVGGQERRADDGLLPLGDEAAVFELAGRWMFEEGGTARAVEDGETVVVAGRAWRLRLPGGLPATEATDEAPLTLASLTLHFEVSRDEEHVSWWATHDGGRLALGDRAFNYTVLTLARQRLAEAEHDSEAGWLDRERLLRMLALEPETLRVHLYRARKALAAAGVRDASSLIQRRATAGQMRIGTDRIEVSTA